MWKDRHPRKIRGLPRKLEQKVCVLTHSFEHLSNYVSICPCTHAHGYHTHCQCTHRAVYLPSTLPRYSVTAHMCTTCIHRCNYVPVHVCTCESAHFNYVSARVHLCTCETMYLCTYTTHQPVSYATSLLFKHFLTLFCEKSRMGFPSETDAANWSPH